MNLGIFKYMIVGQYHLCLGDLKLRYIYKQFYIWTSLCTERHYHIYTHVLHYAQSVLNSYTNNVSHYTLTAFPK